MKPAQITAVVLAAVFSLGTLGCQEGTPSQKQQGPAAAEQPRRAVLLDRYELHEIRNGNTISTALLDKQTGRIWVAQAVGKDAIHVFMPIDVFSKPDGTMPADSASAASERELAPDPELPAYDKNGNRIVPSETIPSNPYEAKRGDKKVILGYEYTFDGSQWVRGRQVR